MISDGVVHSLLSVNMEKLHHFPGPITSGGLMRIKDGRHLQGDRDYTSNDVQGLCGFVPEDPGRQQSPGPRKPKDDVVFL